jgi:hypothetical protein
MKHAVGQAFMQSTALVMKAKEKKVAAFFQR